MSVAIRGYGYFAAPCKQISPDQLPLLLTHLLKRSAFLVSSYVYDLVICDRLNYEVEHANQFILSIFM